MSTQAISTLDTFTLSAVHEAPRLVFDDRNRVCAWMRIASPVDSKPWDRWYAAVLFDGTLMSVKHDASTGEREPLLRKLPYAISYHQGYDSYLDGGGQSAVGYAVTQFSADALRHACDRLRGRSRAEGFGFRQSPTGR